MVVRASCWEAVSSVAPQGFVLGKLVFGANMNNIDGDSTCTAMKSDGDIKMNASTDLIQC